MAGSVNRHFPLSGPDRTALEKKIASRCPEIELSENEYGYVLTLGRFRVSFSPDLDDSIEVHVEADHPELENPVDCVPGLQPSGVYAPPAALLFEYARRPKTLPALMLAGADVLEWIIMLKPSPTYFALAEAEDKVEYAVKSLRIATRGVEFEWEKYRELRAKAANWFMEEDTRRNYQ